MKNKVIIAVLLVLCIVATFAFARSTTWNIHTKPTSDWLSSGDGKDTAWNWMKEADGLLALGFNPGTGTIFYVDSNVTTEGDGSSWSHAKDTLDEAVNLCTDSRGDFILVAQGHAETFLAQSADLDVIGITVIGIGNGSLRPTITFGHTSAEIAIGADNVTLKNFRLICTVTGVLMGIEVEAGADWFRLEGCELTSAGDNIGTDEFVEAVNFAGSSISSSIVGCSFNAEAAGAAHAIFLDGAAAGATRLSIVGNDMRGDYSVACIGGDTTLTQDILIKDNILINGSLVAASGQNAVAAISMLTGSAGLVADNRIVSDVATGAVMVVGDAITFMNNIVTDEEGATDEGTLRSDGAAVTLFTDGN